MNIQPGMKVVLKDFNYCQENLDSESSEKYDISLPNEMEKYFRYKFVTVTKVMPEIDGLHFRIEEDRERWSYHIDWIRSTSVLPDYLFEI